MHGLQTRLFDRHGLASKSATKELVRQLYKINPNIIHLHNIHGYYLNFEILFEFIKQANIPIVWTLHDCWPITGHCVHFEFAECEKWKTQCSHCPEKKSYPASYFIDRSTKNFNLKNELFSTVIDLTLVPVSSWLANILNDSFLNNKPVKVIHNGINTEIFQPTFVQKFRVKQNLKSKFIILGVTSVWGPRKGLNDFIKLSNKLSSNFQIVLVGLTKKQIANLPKNVIGIEKTENVQELAELYSLGDVFVNPTYEDNFPTTNLEAMACGTPVITYKAGGSPEAVDKNTGIVIEKGDIEGIVHAIMDVKSNGKIHYTTKCRERVLSHFNKEDRHMEYIKLYEEILIGKKS